jgi:hypothetical protein
MAMVARVGIEKFNYGFGVKVIAWLGKKVVDIGKGGVH